MVLAAEQEFAVTLSKAKATSELGIEVDHAEDINILIKGIHGGVVLAWNEAHPELAIRPGDRILEVNGARGDVYGTARLVQEIQQCLTLELKLSRVVDSASDSPTADAKPDCLSGLAISSAVPADLPVPERVPEHLADAFRILQGPLAQCCPHRWRAARLAEKTHALAERHRALDLAGPPQRGDLYGLELPNSLQQLQELGAPWLTRALHAAGTLPWGNEVESVPAVRGAERGDAARLAVAWMAVKYRSQSADLPQEFCVVLPPVATEQRVLAWREDLQQVLFMRFFGASLPFRSPKFYFGDVSTSTGAFVLICERIRFAEEVSEERTLAAGDVHPRLHHALPYSVLDQNEKYYALFRKAALLAAFAHAGRLGEQLEDLFEQPYGAFAGGSAYDPISESDFQELWQASNLRHLVLQAWQKLLPEDAATPIYVAQLRKEALDVAQSLVAIRAYLLSASSAYADLLCPEASLEDVFFWRDDAALLDCGLHSFRSIKRGHVCECFGGLHFAPADTRIAHSKGFVRCFTDTLEEFGGPRLDPAEVYLQVSLHDMARILTDILENAKATYAKLQPTKWEEIVSREDDSLVAATQSSLDLRRGLVGIVDGIAAWKGLGYHRILTRWQAAVELLPLGDRLGMRWVPCWWRRSACASEFTSFLDA